MIEPQQETPPLLRGCGHRVAHRCFAGHGFSPPDQADDGQDDGAEQADNARQQAGRHRRIQPGLRFGHLHDDAESRPDQQRGE
jgi:hypothetical protein